MYAPLTERKIENEADLVPDYYVDRPVSDIIVKLLFTLKAYT